MKMTMCQCRKGSGFLNGSWRHVRNHKILLVQVTVVRFSLTKIKHTKVAKACGLQASKIKTWSFEMFLKWCYSSAIFCYAVNFIGHGQSRKLKLDYMAKSIGIHSFWFEYILDVIEIPKPKKTFWPYGHFLIIIFRMDAPYGCITS